MPNFPAFPTLGRGPSGVAAPGSAREPKPAVLTAGFGGNYSQRSGDGINALSRDFSYRSAVLPTAQILQLNAFLEERRGYKPFTYQPPGEGSPRQFICSNWRVVHDNQLYASLVAQFEENFDP